MTEKEKNKNGADRINNSKTDTGTAFGTGIREGGENIETE